jgi:hypothetical protein
LIVCEPRAEKPKDEVSWDQVRTELKSSLKKHIVRFQRAHMYGSDLAASLIAPTVAKTSEYTIVDDEGIHISLGELITERLPVLSRQCEFEVILDSDPVENDDHLRDVISKHCNPERKNGEWLRLQSDHPVIETAQAFADHLQDGSSEDADEIWSSLEIDSKNALEKFLRAAALSSESKDETKAAQAALGRVSRLRR